MKKRMLSFLLAIALVLAMLPYIPLSSRAATTESGRIGDLYWELEDGVLTISGEGEMIDFDYAEEGIYEEDERYCHSNSPWDCYCDEINAVVIEQGVTSIGDHAFMSCRNIKRVLLPDGLTSIGLEAFWLCDGMEYIELPDSLTEIGEFAFGNCWSLTELRLPEGITEIKQNTFAACYSLVLTLSDNISKIEYDSGLWDCVGILVSENNPYFYVDDNGVIYNKEKTNLILCPDIDVDVYSVLEGVKTIDEYAFLWCDFSEVIFPSTLESIGRRAFMHSSLKKVVIPGNVKEIGATAFFDCSKLESVTICEGVEIIGPWAFYACPSLESIYIPPSVSMIGGGPFGACLAMKELRIDTGNPYYCNDADGAIFSKDMTTLVQAPVWKEYEEYVIPYGVKTIAEAALGDWSGLKRVVIPETVSFIDTIGIYGCYELTEIFFTGSAPEFGEAVFENVTATVYYPEGNRSWTADVMQDYNGDLTWLASEIPDFYPDEPEQTEEESVTEPEREEYPDRKDEDEEDEDDDEDEDRERNSGRTQAEFSWIWIVLGGVIVLLVVIIVILIVLLKRKK